jgi:hypothetical protein
MERGILNALRREALRAGCPRFEKQNKKRLGKASFFVWITF